MHRPCIDHASSIADGRGVGTVSTCAGQGLCAAPENTGLPHGRRIASGDRCFQQNACSELAAAELDQFDQWKAAVVDPSERRFLHGARRTDARHAQVAAQIPPALPIAGDADGGNVADMGRQCVPHFVGITECAEVTVPVEAATTGLCAVARSTPSCKAVAAPVTGSTRIPNPEVTR